MQTTNGQFSLDGIDELPSPDPDLFDLASDVRAAGESASQALDLAKSTASDLVFLEFRVNQLSDRVDEQVSLSPSDEYCVKRAKRLRVEAWERVLFPAAGALSLGCVVLLLSALVSGTPQQRDRLAIYASRAGIGAISTMILLAIVGKE